MDIMSKIYKCTECNNSYQTIQALSSHKWSCHTEEGIEFRKNNVQHLIDHSAKIKNTKKYNAEDIFIEGSTASKDIIKRYYLSIVDYKCKSCSISEWNNQPIVLQIEHKNGVNTDNRLENLELLCPNCHSQTKTYCRRNDTKTVYIADAQIISIIVSGKYKNIRDILFQLNLNDSGSNYKRITKLIEKLVAEERI